MTPIFIYFFSIFSDVESFDEITESSIVRKIEMTCGNIVNEIENEVIQLYMVDE